MTSINIECCCFELGKDQQSNLRGTSQSLSSSEMWLLLKSMREVMRFTFILEEVVAWKNLVLRYPPCNQCVLACWRQNASSYTRSWFI